MEEMIKKAIEEYQCSGCVAGSDTECGSFELDVTGTSKACKKHCAGTSLFFGTGMIRLFLGMPKGFNRVGLEEHLKLKIQIFKSQEEKDSWFPYDKFNIPVWKYKNKSGHTFIRGLSPRINRPFLHIILNCDFDSIDCLEMTEDDLKEMD